MFEGPASVLTPDISKKIVDLYIESIKQDKEFSMLVCNNNAYPLKSISNERMTKVEIGVKDVKEMCKGDPEAIYLHTHGNFQPQPSLMDYKANKKIFKLPGVQHSCIAGTSGFFCLDRAGRDVTYQWGDKYFESVENEKSVEIMRGDSLFCDRVGNRYSCDLSLNSFSKYIGMFDNISVEEAMLGEMGTDVLSQVHSPEMMLECTIRRDPLDLKSTLNCFKKSESEINNERSSGRLCNYIDICRPKM